MTWTVKKKKTLVYGGSFDEDASSIRAKIFGVMVGLAEGQIKLYRSDLFHDAMWIQQNVNGPMWFDWIIRSAGTFIGEAVQNIKLEEWPDSTKYRFELLYDGNQWVLIVWENETIDKIPLQDHSLHEDASFELDEAVAFGTEERYPILVPASQNPTLGNIENLNQSKGEKIKMDDVVEGLRDKAEEANNIRDSLDEYKGEINSALEELDDYIVQVEELIESLGSLPEISVYVDLNTVQFDSN